MSIMPFQPLLGCDGFLERGMKRCYQSNVTGSRSVRSIANAEGDGRKTSLVWMKG